MDKIKVIVVDDSLAMRQLLVTMLASDPEIVVVASAADPFEARDKIKTYDPDVMTLDAELPRMHGMVFLKNVMRLRPMPVIMLSHHIEPGSQRAFDALAAGAVDCVGKPHGNNPNYLHGYRNDLAARVKAAARGACIEQPRPAAPSAPTLRDTTTAPCATAAPARTLGGACASAQVIAIGASTGGPEALHEVIGRLDPNGPPVLIVQHISPTFTDHLIRRLQRGTAMRVQQAEHYGGLRPGGIYVAPPHQHLELTRNGADYVTVTSDLPPLHYHRPSVDVLFHSVARSAGANAIGVILTGMGCDGAAGITAMRNHGAITIAQDEASSVVWGMPGAAVKSSGVDYVLPVTDIANTINDLMNHRQRTGRIAHALH